jgi:OPT oligopeptide transporter protein
VGGRQCFWRSGSGNVDYRSDLVYAYASSDGLLDLHKADYRNALYSAFMPILSSSIFDNTGNIYNVTKILTPEFMFDEESFKNYSPIYLPITYVLSYAVQFAALTALATHTICWHGTDIWQQTKESFSGQAEGRKSEYQPINQAPSTSAQENRHEIPNAMQSVDHDHDYNMTAGDVHNRLMKRYEDAPITWYLAIFVAMLTIGIFIVE